MRHLRRKRWIPSSKLCGISRNQTRWQVIKSCQLNVLSPVYLLHHVHADIIATHWYSKYPSMIVRLCKACRGSGMRMPFLLKSRCFTCHLVKDEFDQEDSIRPLFVCHVLDKVPFVLQICLLYGLPVNYIKLWKRTNFMLKFKFQYRCSKRKPSSHLLGRHHVGWLSKFSLFGPFIACRDNVIMF